jgi:hypothetical protein
MGTQWEYFKKTHLNQNQLWQCATTAAENGLVTIGNRSHMLVGGSELHGTLSNTSLLTES